MKFSKLKWPGRAGKSKTRSKAALEKVLVITPPEGVPIRFLLADVGQRAGAQLIDFFVTLAGAVLLTILLVIAFGGASPSALTVVISLIFFGIRVPYYALSELLWNGRTLAKRWFGLRVVSVSGNTLTAQQIIMRNLMKEVEFFIPLTTLIGGSALPPSVFLMSVVWASILLIVPLRSRRNQRLGDLLANTAVILDPKPLLLNDLARNQSGSAQRFVFSTQQLDHYGRYELQVLETILRASQSPKAEADDSHISNRRMVVEKITSRIGYPETINETDDLLFLNAFYTAQRAHLENLKLFGDAREDKHFAEMKDL